MHLATAKGNLAMTKFLLGSIADVNTRISPSSSTALHLATKNGYAAVLQTLLDHGANVNIMRHDTDRASQYTALRLAVLIEDAASANVLLDRGADINALHLNGQWLFNPAETSLYEFRTTVLFDAVAQQSEDIVNLLLDRGADANMGDATPLYRAVLDSNGRMVSLLIENGADPRIPGAIGILKHLYERRLMHSSPEEFFSSANFLGQALVAVANVPEPGRAAEILINSGANINFISIHGRLLCPLSSVTDCDIQLVSRWLTESVESGEPVLDFPLHAASRSGNEPLVRLLLNRGAKTWSVDKEIWLQQTILAKPKATHLQGVHSRNVIRVIYEIIRSDDIRETLRKNGYSDRHISAFDRIERHMSQAIRIHRCLGAAMIPSRNYQDFKS